MEKYTTADELLRILTSQLARTDHPQQTEAELLRDTVDEYLYVLSRSGNVPHFLNSILEEDLLQEALEFYRKKTYGYGSLEEYRLAVGILIRTG